MTDDIAIDIWSSWNFASMRDIKRKFNSMVDLSKFTSNKKKNIEWSYTLSLQPNLLPNFGQSVIILNLKKFRVVPNI